MGFCSGVASALASAGGNFLWSDCHRHPMDSGLPMMILGNTRQVDTVPL
jgi:hypothetical protein